MRLKTYWHTITHSLTSPQYYLEILRAPFGFSVRFFLISMIFLGLSLAWQINQKLIPSLHQHFNIILDEINANYPQQLSLTWNKGQLSSSTTQIIEIAYPSFIDLEPDLPPTLGYFIPEDVSASQLTTILDQESMFVITKHNFLVNDFQGTWAEIPLVELLPSTQLILDKDTSAKLITQFKQKLVTFIYLAKRLNFIIVPIGLIIAKFWRSFLESMLIFLFFRLNKIKLKFSHALKLSLHLTVIAEIINQLAHWIYPQVQISMFFLAYWSIFGYIFWTQKKQFFQLKTETTPQD